MNIPGERFNLSLDQLDDLLGGGGGDEDDFDHLGVDEATAPPVMNFVGDIVEKPTSTTPSAPTLPQSTPTGFPAHKKRIPKNPSRFKQRAAAQPPPQQQPKTERQQISEDNERRLANMSKEEIEEERQELMSKLSPALIQRLLNKANMDEAPPSTRPTAEKQQQRPSVVVGSARPDPIPKPPPPKAAREDAAYDPDDAAPPIYDPSLFPDTGSYHFPRAPQSAPELDPSSPEFLKSLHEKYFPELPADPSKLAWMTPVSEREDMSCYHPSQSDLLPSALRFDFKGELLPPRKAREISTALGLHHHADAPAAAGYTVPELARLARSTFPSQRCMAMQTLGRIMYKLGTGYYGVPEIEMGLWRCIEEGRVLEGLQEAANAKGGHLSVKAYATDALWLWQKGGGKKVQAA
ncbi:RPAP1-like protein [Sphaerosporella brunnea]|uniref:RPAP1-like protein n=1 Tax=Sphaerosporella brunnea TaxID=1250544 RepID=A0A5J5F3H2_9PEZI|nr:RPAP1-like protein [Sphaerosporella brunnea]